MRPRGATVAVVARGADLAAALRAGLRAAGIAPVHPVAVAGGAQAAESIPTAAQAPGLRAILIADPLLDAGDALLAALDDARANRRRVVVMRPRPAGDWDVEVEDAALERHGALLAWSPDDAVEIARALHASGRRATGPIAVVTSHASLENCVRGLAEQAGVAYGPAPRAWVLRVPEDLPLVGARARLTALRLVAEHARRLAAPPPAPPAAPRPARARALDLLERSEPTLTEREARALLSLYGIASPAEEVASSPSAAAAAARRVGFPVSLRVVTPDVRDVAAVGGVALGVQNGAQARGAYVRVLVAAHERAPSARLEGVLVAKAPPPGVRVRIAARRHARLGAAIALGVAGPPAPIDAPRAIRLAPLAAEEAETMVATAPVTRRLLAHPPGARRGSPDIRALAAAVQRLSLLAWDLRDALLEAELTVVVRPRGEGCVVVEAGATRVP